jgi:hypothetical protein
MQPVGLRYDSMKLALALLLLLGAAQARAQVQVELKLPRLQFIAYEPVTATIGITNLAGRDIELHDADGENWFGFEVTGSQGQSIGPIKALSQPPLKIAAGQHVTQKINLTPLFQVQDYGAYHVRAHIYFPDLGKFFYSQAKVFEVTDARPIWQQTVGMPDGAGPGNARTYSLMTNRFPDHTSLYVRIANKDTGVVYATYSLGRMIIYDDPKVQIDKTNQLHVLHCSAPRTWSYSVIGLNGEVVSHTTYMETKTRPRLLQTADGMVAVRGGMAEVPASAAAKAIPVPKLSDRPANDE